MKGMAYHWKTVLDVHTASQQFPDDIERVCGPSPTAHHEKADVEGEGSNNGPCTPPAKGSESAFKSLGWQSQKERDICPGYVTHKQ